MTVLEWDKVGDRVYQTGIDKGVLYLKDGTVVPWNGITSVEDGSNSELKSYYLDGVKILDHVTPGDFVGKLKAITYPDEFDTVMGIEEAAAGLFFHEQSPKSFNLSYRTLIGNDVEGPSYGYKINLLYNLIAVPDSQSHQTLDSSPTLTEFAWSLSGTPEVIIGHRSTVHISVDSTRADPVKIQALEDIIYGTAESDPRFPTITEVRVLFDEIGALLITDNGDGTWTASDFSDDYISMIDSDTFRIDHADAEFLDLFTYEISDTSNPI